MGKTPQCIVRELLNVLTDCPSVLLNTVVLQNVLTEGRNLKIPYLAIDVAMLGLIGLTSRIRSFGRITRSMSSMGITPRST